MLPAIVTVKAKINLDKRLPLWTFGLSNQMDPSFLGRSVGFLSITRNAGTNNILPRSWTTAVFGYHVIEIKIFSIEDPAAVLTSILITLKNIIPCEFHFLLR